MSQGKVFEQRLDGYTSEYHWWPFCMDCEAGLIDFTNLTGLHLRLILCWKEIHAQSLKSQKNSMGLIIRVTASSFPGTFLIYAYYPSIILIVPPFTLISVPVGWKTTVSSPASSTPVSIPPTTLNSFRIFLYGFKFLKQTKSKQRMIILLVSVKNCLWIQREREALT